MVTQEEATDAIERESKKSDKKKGMSDYELKGIIEKFIQNSLSYANSNLSSQRSESIKSYYGDKYGDEVPYRSQVISRDLFDAVEWMLPTLIDTFLASGTVVEFIPQNQSDVAQAQQETDYINYLFFSENRGFLQLYVWMKDSLLQKNGIMKFSPVERTKVTFEVREGLSDDEFMLLMQQLENPEDEVEREVVEHSEDQKTILIPNIMDGGYIERPVTLHDVKIKMVRHFTKIEIFAIPPEEFFITPNQTTLDLENCMFSCHRRNMTITDLVEMGFDKELLDTLPTATFPAPYPNQQEAISRQYLNDTYVNRTIYTDDSMRPIEIDECYLYIDYDGDGVSELRQVWYSNNVILTRGGKPAIDEFVSIPFAAMTPIILPHQFYGFSISDSMMELQRIKTVLWRQALDNIYVQNNSRKVVNEAVVEMDDLYEVKPGQIIRANGNPFEAIMELQAPDVSGPIFNMMEYIDKVAEGRTGVSATTTGLDPNILNNNKGDESVRRLMQAATLRISLIARVFAETGMRTLFEGLHKMVRQYQNQQQVINLNQKWVTVDPSLWKERSHLNVRVGLGAGDNDVLRNVMQMFGQIQTQLIEGGKEGVLVTNQNIYNTLKKYADTFGIKDIDTYFTDPNSQQAQQALQAKQQAASQPPPDPTVIKTQAQLQGKQLDAQVKKYQIDTDAKTEVQRLALDKYIADQQDAIKLMALHIQNLTQGLEEHKHVMKTVHDSHQQMRDELNAIKGGGNSTKGVNESIHHE